VVVADSSKFGRSNFVHICDLTEVSVLVTEQAPDSQLQAALAEAEVELVYAPVRTRPES
jgi:DeoR family fructose operon transcriptional repressor